MKKAYYLIDLDFFRRKICLEGHYFDIVEAAQNSYASIRQAGYITFAHECYSIIDTLVGREGYITLSYGKCMHWKDELLCSSFKDGLFGFIFDAHQLLQQGALFGIEQIARDYKRMTQEVIQRVGATLLSDDPEHLEDQDDRLSELVSAIMLALEEKNFDAPGCQQILTEVQQEAHVINSQKLLQGPFALTYLDHAPEDGSCQLLMWQRLAVAQAIGTVSRGEETFL